MESFREFGQQNRNVGSDDLPDHLLGSTANMHFTLDDSGQWEKTKSYPTVGTKLKVYGTIDYPEGPTWTVIGKSTPNSWKKEKNGVETGDTLSFSVPTNLGSTKFTIKVRSERGEQDAGVQGKIVVEV